MVYYEQVWRENEQILDRVCRNKFRSAEDVNQYIFKNEQLVTGRFSPYNWRKNGKAFHMNDGDSEDNNIAEMCHAIENGIYKMICVAVACMSLTACDSWLDVDPSDQYSTETFWKTKEMRATV